MRTILLSVCCLFFISFSQAQSEDSLKAEKRVAPWFVERFKLSAGAFYVVNKTNINVAVNGGNATDINMEKDLGIDKEVGTFIADFQWRISSRSRITLNYFNVSRSAQKTLDKDIIFEDNLYPVNSKVESFFNTTIYQVAYGYSFFQKERFEAGLFLGTHIVHANAGISTNGVSGGASTTNDFGFTAPLPDLGIWGGYAISNRLAIATDVSFFALNIENKSGRLLAFNLNLTYKIIKQLDVTLGYTGLDFKVDVVKKDVTGNFKWGYNGPVLAANFSFGKKSWTHKKVE